MAASKHEHRYGANKKKILKQCQFFLTHCNNWLIENGWAGWDPYDIWDNRFGLWVTKRENYIQRIAKAIISRVNRFAPNTLRKVLNVKPRINAKAMGLFAAGFLQLESVDNFSEPLGDKPGYEPCFRWLDDNKVVRFGGCGWGYPFDWRSRVLIPKNTPTVVNSAIIGDAYWLKYKLHGEKKALAQCENICQFIFSGLNRSSQKPNGAFCFSYTPVDGFQVHNANLFGAEFLIRIGLENGRDDWVRAGKLAANFSLSEIREDGTLNYWSNEQAQGLQQDTYHSGFEIRALNRIACLTGDKKIRQAADRYFQTWIADYFSENGTPGLGRGRFNVIEVHSCAEAILCATKMFETGNFSSELFLKHIQGAMSAADKLWISNNSDKGFFAHRVQGKLGVEIKSAIPYIRWGQAWMILALSECLKSLCYANEG
jgi:hypothetical protein